VLGLVGIAMAAAASTMAISSPDWPRAAMIVLCAAFGGTAIGWNGVYLAEVAREAPPGKTVEATGGALFFTFFGVLITPPLFAAIVEAAEATAWPSPWWPSRRCCADYGCSLVPARAAPRKATSA